MTGRIRLLIVDDHPVVGMGLQGMLAGQPDFEVVAEAATGTEAVEASGRLNPDVVLMDLRMPEMDGVAAITRIQSHHPRTRVLVLTTHDSSADILRAIETGAAGYMLKDAPREELFEAIRATARGEQPLAPSVADRLTERANWPPEEALSAREREVLELVSKGASNREVAGRLWISEATVKSHLMHVYDKLNVPDRTSAVTAALRRGILTLDP